MSSDKTGVESLISLEELGKHTTEEDLWVSIEGKVYNVSKYVDQHPGGVDTLLGAAGKDGTDDFVSVGHSDTAREELKKYLIGKLDPNEVCLLKAAAGGSGGCVSGVPFQIIVLVLAVVIFFAYLMFPT